MGHPTHNPYKITGNCPTQLSQEPVTVPVYLHRKPHHSGGSRQGSQRDLTPTQHISGIDRRTGNIQDRVKKENNQETVSDQKEIKLPLIHIRIHTYINIHTHTYI